jgi:hypothetical protein
MTNQFVCRVIDPTSFFGAVKQSSSSLIKVVEDKVVDDKIYEIEDDLPEDIDEILRHVEEVEEVAVLQNVTGNAVILTTKNKDNALCSTESELSNLDKKVPAILNEENIKPIQKTPKKESMVKDLSASIEKSKSPLPGETKKTSG